MDHTTYFTTNVEVLSYKGVFNDGPKKLHPGFRLGEVLFALTNTKPRHTPYVTLLPSQVESEHFKAKGKYVYITYAYNQDAERFNNVAGGKLWLKDINLIEMECKFHLPDDWKSFVNILNFSQFMNYKVQSSTDGKMFILLADASAHKPTKDLSEFGLQKRVEGGIIGLTTPKVAEKSPAKLLAYFNNTAAPQVIDGTKKFPPEHPIFVELMTAFLPNVLTKALFDLTPQLIGKPVGEGTLTKEAAEAAIQAIRDNASKEADGEYQALASLVSDLLAVYNGEQSDEVALRMNEAFGIDLDQVFASVVPTDLAETIVENVATAVDVDDTVAETTDVAATPAAEGTVPTEESKVSAEVVVPKNVDRLRSMANLAEAASNIAAFVSAEVSAMKKDAEQEAGVEVLPVKAMTALPTGAPVEEEVTV